MRSVFRLPIYTTAAAVAALVLAGCGGGGGGGGTPDPSASALSLVGTVFNGANGTPVAGATVLLAGVNRTATTDASGNYRFDDIATTFTGGELTVNANGFDAETATVTLNGSALQVPNVSLTQTGASVSVAPAAGGTVTQPVAELPSLQPAGINIPAGALPAGPNLGVSLTPVVDPPVDDLVSTLSVSSQAVGDAALRGPEIYVRIRPANIVLTSAAQMTLPLPFALPGGTQVPIIQRKPTGWTEVGVATVDASGAFAVGPITEFLPTGVEAWHGFSRTTHNQPSVQLAEMTLAQIQNDINNLPDRSYVVNKTIQAGQLARITARFNWTFDSPSLPTSPVDEQSLVLGNAQHRARLRERLASGLWNIAGGPVTYSVRQEEVQVKRFLDGQVRDVAGTFVATHGKPSWPRPGDHNQGGIQ